jgi:hypothetical protein
MTAGLRTS